MELSLNTFTRFVAASSRARMGVVREALRRDGLDYDPAQDYWRPLRRTIVAAHRAGRGAAAIRRFVPADDRKATNYAIGKARYLEWLGDREVRWLGASPCDWVSGELTVRVKPDLVMALGGTPHVVQLWCRKDPLGKRQADPILCLLTETHGFAGATVGILDVQRGRLLSADRRSQGLEPLLAGEAASFVAMWHRLRAASLVSTTA
jgi:hypothetical protein